MPRPSQGLRLKPARTAQRRLRVALAVREHRAANLRRVRSLWKVRLPMSQPPRCPALKLPLRSSRGAVVRVLAMSRQRTLQALSRPELKVARAAASAAVVGAGAIVTATGTAIVGRAIPRSKGRPSRRPSRCRVPKMARVCVRFSMSS